MGQWALWGLLAVLVVAYLGGLIGPPPDDQRAVGYVSLALWAFVPWGAWIGKHRELRANG